MPPIVSVLHGAGWSAPSGEAASALMERLGPDVDTAYHLAASIDGAVIVVGLVTEVARLLDDGPGSLPREMVLNCLVRGQREVAALAKVGPLARRLAARGAFEAAAKVRAQHHENRGVGCVVLAVLDGGVYAVMRLLIETRRSEGGVS
jgi:hypothetical protein